jgi:hypothetical protein
VLQLVVGRFAGCAALRCVVAFVLFNYAGRVVYHAR